MVFSARLYPLTCPFLVTGEKGDVIDSYSSIFEELVVGPPSTMWSASVEDKMHLSGSEKEHQRRLQQQLAEEYIINVDSHHKEVLVSKLLQECLGWRAKSVRSSAFLARYV